MTHDDEHLRHIRVLESQVEGNREVVAALREVENNLMVRIDDSASETVALVETAFIQIDELRGILHRLEDKIDALALSLNGDHSDGAVRSAQAARSPDHAIPSSEIGPSVRPTSYVGVAGLSGSPSPIRSTSITACLHRNR
jgi:hypothetical protein